MQAEAERHATAALAAGASTRPAGFRFPALVPRLRDRAFAWRARIRSFCAVHDPRWAVGAF